MATIAIDATYVVDPQPSGVSVYSRRLIESLAELESGHRFLVCYRVSRWGSRQQFLSLGQARTREGGRQEFSTRLFQYPWTFWLPRQANLFHSLAQRPAPFRFRHEIVTIHDVFPLSSREYSTPSFQRKFSVLLIEAARRAARIITPSQHTANELIRHVQVDPEKIRVIPEGVDLPKQVLSPDARLSERARWVGEGNELILVVGVIQTRKNTLGALQALEKLPEHCCMVLAGGAGHGSEAVQDYLRKTRLDKRVKALGHVSGEQLERLYQAASLLLFPSFDEGFGLPVLEAMAYGLPVVTSLTSALPEVGGEAALYVDPHDMNDIAEKVIRVIENPQLRTQMVEAGLVRVQAFSWRRVAEQTLEVYNEVLGE
jgi:glycosyltransferase involved in cell wall biosynthesis